jgi:hypothetical protein
MIFFFVRQFLHSLDLFGRYRKGGSFHYISSFHYEDNALILNAIQTYNYLQLYNYKNSYLTKYSVFNLFGLVFGADFGIERSLIQIRCSGNEAAWGIAAIRHRERIARPHCWRGSVSSVLVLPQQWGHAQNYYGNSLFLLDEFCSQMQLPPRES